MNKISIVIIFLFTLLFTFSCKKGENDPLISLLSRKYRITGTWNLKEGQYTYNSPGVYELKLIYDGQNAEEYVNGDLSNTFEYTVRFTINKDFTYEKIINENGFVKEENGNWFFTKKSKQLDLKNKEAIALSISSTIANGVTTEYTGVTVDELLLIDRLKNDEVIFKGERTYTSTVTDTETYDYSFVKI